MKSSLLQALSETWTCCRLLPSCEGESGRWHFPDHKSMQAILWGYFAQVVFLRTCFEKPFPSSVMGYIQSWATSRPQVLLILKAEHYWVQGQRTEAHLCVVTSTVQERVSLPYPINVRLGHMTCFGQWNKSGSNSWLPGRGSGARVWFFYAHFPLHWWPTLFR